MNRKLTSRLIAVVLVGVAFGIFFYQDHQKFHNMGRDAYMARQGQQWDRLYADTSAKGLTIVSGCVIAALAVGIYELIAGIVHLVLKKLMPETPDAAMASEADWPWPGQPPQRDYQDPDSY
jgi:predicted PurR-regulated permease PerM